MMDQDLRALREKLIDPANNPLPESRRRSGSHQVLELNVNQAAAALGGGLLVGLGLARRSWTGLAIAGIGGYLLYNACQTTMGQCNLPHSTDPNLGLKDRVDEASWESFPASDPPSYSPT